MATTHFIKHGIACFALLLLVLPLGMGAAQQPPPPAPPPIAFTTLVDDSRAEGFILHRIEGDTHTMTTFPDLREPNMLAVSPDGTRLAFMVLGTLYTVGSDGANLQTIATYGRCDLMGLVWSADGERLLVTTNFLGMGKRNPRQASAPCVGISIVQADGSAVQEVTTGQFYYPAIWSTDEAWIFYTDVDGLHRIRDDGSAAQTLVERPIDSSAGSVWTEPRLSPDGAWVAALDHNRHLHLLQLDGNAPLEPNLDPANAIAWLPDNTLAYTHARDIWRYDPTTDTSTLLVDLDYGSSLHASPDGEWLLWTETVMDGEMGRYELAFGAVHPVTGTRWQPETLGNNPLWLPTPPDTEADAE